MVATLGNTNVALNRLKPVIQPPLTPAESKLEKEPSADSHITEENEPIENNTSNKDSLTLQQSQTKPTRIPCLGRHLVLSK